MIIVPRKSCKLIVSYFQCRDTTKHPINVTVQGYKNQSLGNDLESYSGILIKILYCYELFCF